MNPTRVLVTGGVGFIGTHVVEELRATGHEVRVVDALHPAAHVGPPAALHPDVEYLWGDLADPEVARHAVAGVDSVCHQAAMVGLGVDFRDRARVRASHDLATAQLLAALHARAFTGRIVLASSMVVYGEGRYRCREHGVVARAAPRGAPRRGSVRTTVSSMWRTIDMRTRHRGRAHRSAQRVCGDEAAPRALEQRIRARAHAEHRHRTSVPQRVRARHAA